MNYCCLPKINLTATKCCSKSNQHFHSAQPFGSGYHFKKSLSAPPPPVPIATSLEVPPTKNARKYTSWYRPPRNTHPNITPSDPYGYCDLSDITVRRKWVLSEVCGNQRRISPQKKWYWCKKWSQRLTTPGILWEDRSRINRICI